MYSFHTYESKTEIITDFHRLEGASGDESDARFMGAVLAFIPDKAGHVLSRFSMEYRQSRVNQGPPAPFSPNSIRAATLQEMSLEATLHFGRILGDRAAYIVLGTNHQDIALSREERGFLMGVTLSFEDMTQPGRSRLN